MASNGTTEYYDYAEANHVDLQALICMYVPSECDRLLQISIGGTLTILSVIILCLTFLVVFAHFKSGNLSKNGSAIFVLSTWHLCVSSCIVVIIGGYIGPTTFLHTPWPDDWKKHQNPFGTSLGQFMFALIFCGSLFNIVIAVNRVLAMRGAKSILSRQFYMIISICIIPCGFILSYVPTHTMPCCKQVYNYAIYSFLSQQMLPGGIFTQDVVFEYIWRPFYILSTIIPVVCYSYIFGFTFWTRHKNVAVKTKGRSELYRSILFAFVFFFYMCSWIYYDLIKVAHFFDPSLPFHILSMYFMLFEAGANAICQLFMIATVRRTLKKLFRIENQTFFSSTSVTPLKNLNNLINATRNASVSNERLSILTNAAQPPYDHV